MAVQVAIAGKVMSHKEVSQTMNTAKGNLTESQSDPQGLSLIRELGLELAASYGHKYE